MSVDNKNVIDFISIDKEGSVILTISDHLDWDSKNEHLLILQEKINTYLGAIEGGELYSNYPKATGRKIVIRVVALYDPNKDGSLFLQRAKEVLEASGYGFVFERREMN